MIVPAPRATKAGAGRIGQAGERGDIEVDDSSHLLDVRLQEGCDGRDAGIIDQQGDVGVVAQHGLHRGALCRVGEVGRQQLYGAPGLGGQAGRERLQLRGVAGHQDEVVAALGQTVGIDGADASGGAGDEGRAEGRLGH